MRLILTALLFAALALPAGDPPGFSIWTSADLKAFAKSLPLKMNEQKTATQQLTAFANYSFMVAHREASGEGEFHETQADIFVVQSGEATLVYGGELVNPRTTAPHEMRAASIQGGMEKKIAAGDIVTIPAKTAHQVKLDPGKKFTYFVVKVTQ